MSRKPNMASNKQLAISQNGSQSSRSFLDLPAEIRNLIYSYNLPSKNEPRLIRLNKASEGQKAPPLPLAMYRTCKAIFWEFPSLEYLLYTGALIPVIDISLDKLKSGKQLVSDQAILKVLPSASRLRLLSSDFFDQSDDSLWKLWRKSEYATEILQGFLRGLPELAPQPLPWNLVIDKAGRPNNLTLGHLTTQNCPKLPKTIEIEAVFDPHCTHFSEDHKRAIKRFLKPLHQTVLLDNIHKLELLTWRENSKPISLAKFNKEVKRWLERIIDFELGSRMQLDYADEKIELTKKEQREVDKEANDSEDDYSEDDDLGV